MELLSLISDNLPVVIILVAILVINFCCIIYLVFKERKEDKKEIEEILTERNSKNEISTKIEEEQDEKLEENKKEVEEMLMKMQQDLETKPEDVVTNFENEQEEKSIISYQELLESVKQKQEVKVTPVKIEEKEVVEPVKEEIVEEPIINEDVAKKIRLEEEAIKELNEKTTIKEISEEEEKFNKIEESLKNVDDLEDTKRFRNTDFISPIFGRQENNIKYPTVPKTKSTIEETINKKETKTTKLEEELAKNESFLKALKDFRKNLD